MIKKLTQFVTESENIIEEFKQYLANESIPIAERWYTFILFGHLLPSVSIYNYIYENIYKKYELDKNYNIRNAISWESEILCVDFIKLLEYNDYDFELINIVKNELLKAGAHAMYMD